ncbi:hypothetical protein C480_17452 [Natrialba aegyptia DSM 13077]|uniref:Uncharacterized protein n=1 Tax=Natrialba aegyptia DSM 13077 TaxID=1227491 RepID=M0ATW3_9EURY|nr:MarR family transcriptional regulator [Natrialba aegyptia]ELZ02141.1 hypothetical protein C480_17452 [Natrialba aegyptia DSM 13077]
MNELSDVLSGATLRVLYYLEISRAATDLARRADHRSTVHRALDPLQHREIVYQTDDDAYALNVGFEQWSPDYQQAVTAAGMGSMAALDVEDWLKSGVPVSAEILT